MKGKIKTVEIAGSPGKTTTKPYKASSSTVQKDYIPFGSDNLFPQAIEHLNRHSGAHRGILVNKVKFFTGKGIAYGDNPNLESIVDDLTALAPRYFRDKGAGNAYIQIAWNSEGVRIFHVDHVKCRVGNKEHKGNILIHPNWANYQNEKSKMKVIPIFPEYVEEDGLKWSMYHVKEYEPDFEHYGIPDFIAGVGAASIAYKTNKWNLSRLDNGYKISGVLVVDGQFTDEKDEKKFDEDLDEVYSDEEGRGKILKVKKNSEGDQSKWIPFNQQDDADWISLTGLSRDELLIAHQWYPGLAGFNTKDGFNTDRLLTEYQMALSSSIIPAQNRLLEVVSEIYWTFGNIDLSELEFINRAPVLDSPDSMMVWEDRKARGLDYDPEDPMQQIYLAELRGLRSISLTPESTKGKKWYNRIFK